MLKMLIKKSINVLLWTNQQSQKKEGRAACAPFVKSLRVTEHSEPIGQGIGTGKKEMRNS